MQALSVATNAENKDKNGSDSILPFDRNRVILTPDGTRSVADFYNTNHNDMIIRHQKAL